MNNELSGEDKKIIAANPTVVFGSKGLLVISLYQGRYEPLYLPNHNTFEYQGKVYRKLKCLFDIIEYDSKKLNELCLEALERSSYWILFEGLQGALREDALLPDDHGPKGIILVLGEVGNPL